MTIPWGYSKSNLNYRSMTAWLCLLLDNVEIDDETFYVKQNIITSSRKHSTNT